MKKNKSKVRYNNLAIVHPELAKQWHPTKNGDLLPTQVTVGSGKKYIGYVSTGMFGQQQSQVE